MSWFVTATDTGVGKTLVSCALLHALAARSEPAVGMKPVAAGCEQAPDGRWVNDDVAALCAASSFAAPLELVNPYCFREAIAPHIAAHNEGVRIDTAVIAARFDELAARCSTVVVEGAGGFRVPLNEREDTADLAMRLGLPVVLVVGMRLGCISHALLTADAIRARSLRLAGWVANRIDPHMARVDENLAALRQRLGAPLLGVVPYMAVPAAPAVVLTLPD